MTSSSPHLSRTYPRPIADKSEFAPQGGDRVPDHRGRGLGPDPRRRMGRSASRSRRHSFHVLLRGRRVSYQTIEVHKSTPNIGAEILGVDLSKPLGNQHIPGSA